jgi:RimJ/RimL family protein N-acetyltransferase
MTIATSLFEDQHICLGAIDHEKDPQVESRWTQDPAYTRALLHGLARPQSPARVKKKYEAIEKAVEEEKNTFYFAIRSKSDDRLLGFVRLHWIEWSHGTGVLELAIGDPAERRQGYASEAMRLILRYAFDELNLYRLTAYVAEDNQPALGLLKKFGFREEVRRRKAIQHDGYICDLLHFGLLREEWKQA